MTSSPTWRNALAGAALLLAPSLIEGSSFPLRTSGSETTTQSPLVIAHRSNGCGLGRENSRRAIDDCVRKGVQGIEIDIRYTQDRVPILHHNPTIRLSNSKKRVNELTIAHIQEERSGRYEIAELADILQEYHGKIMFDLDLKESDLAPTVEAIVQANAFDSTYIRLSKQEHYAQFAQYAAQYPRLNGMPRLWTQAHLDHAQAAGTPFRIAEVSSKAPTELLEQLRTLGVYPQTFVRLSFLFPCRKYQRQVEQGIAIIQADTPLWLMRCSKKD